MRSILICYPILLSTFSPLITTLDVHDLSVTIIDYDNSPLSLRTTADIMSSVSMNYIATADYHTALDILNKGELDVIVQIPNDMEKSLLTESPKQIDITTNALNSIKGALGSAYVMEQIQNTIQSWATERALADSSNSLSDNTVSLFLFNPTENYYLFMIPGLLCILTLMIPGFMPALSILSERDSGTLEQINVSPLQPSLFILCKMMPFWLFTTIGFIFAMLLSYVFYDVAPIGNLLTILLAVLLCCICMSGICITVANCSKNMLQAMFIMLVIILGSELMCGLITPIDSMHPVAQWFTTIIPARHIISIMRSVYIKGSNISQLTTEFSILALSASIFLYLAFYTYRKRE